MKRLRENVSHKRPYLCILGFCIIIAPSHKAITVNKFLAQHSTNIVDLLSYSYFLLPKLKLPLAVIRFERFDTIKKIAEETEGDRGAYKKCMGDWERNSRWRGCIASMGPTLKAIKQIWVKNNPCVFYLQISDTFLEEWFNDNILALHILPLPSNINV